MRLVNPSLSVQIYGLAFLLLLTGAAHAQAQEQEDVVKVKSNLVNIDVIVKDKKGKYISDLKPEDFTITEDGQAQKIEFFDAPIVRIEIHKPGKYQAMIETKDMVTRKSTKQEAPFEIMP
jgi:hypothetical protein